MGVDRTDYIILGYKLPFDYLKKFGINIWDDKFLPYIEGYQGIKHSLIIDGMSGEYIVFGERIEQAEESEGFTFNVIDPSIFDAERASTVQKLFIELFDEPAFANRPDTNPKVLIFSHFS